jgi:hypothetical protein
VKGSVKGIDIFWVGFARRRRSQADNRGCPSPDVWQSKPAASSSGRVRPPPRAGGRPKHASYFSIPIPSPPFATRGRVQRGPVPLLHNGLSHKPITCRQGGSGPHLCRRSPASLRHGSCGQSRSPQPNCQARKAGALVRVSCLFPLSFVPSAIVPPCATEEEVPLSAMMGGR